MNFEASSDEESAGPRVTLRDEPALDNLGHLEFSVVNDEAL